jgi:hypothetical protein
MSCCCSLLLTVVADGGRCLVDVDRTQRDKKEDRRWMGGEVDQQRADTVCEWREV